MTKVDLNLAINTFRSVLSCSWPHIMKLVERDKTDEFLIDWLQANWEMIVEASIPPKFSPRLEHYGEGADCNGNSCRVWEPAAVANYQVICIPKDNYAIVDVISGKKVEGKLILDEFCTIKDDLYICAPPFDYANIRVTDKSMPNPCIIDINSIEFGAWRIPGT